MSAYTVNIDLPATILGDDWVGISEIGPTTVNGIDQGELTRITMRFTSEKTSAVFNLDTNGDGDAPIVIDDASAPWEAHIDPVATFLPKIGDWNWTMKFYHDGDVSPVTLYSGVLTVVDTNNP